MDELIRINLNDVKYLQIGCGKQHFPQRDGWANLDISDACKPDILWDVRDGLPMFGTSSLEVVTANGILEMILPNEEFRNILNEIWRVLKPDGRISGQVPSIDPRVLMLDPFDRRWFKEETFNYWDVDQHAWKEFGTQYGFLPWNVKFAKTNENGIILFEMSPAKK